MTKPFVALYKVYRGGEWFSLSLESIARHVDGIVIVSGEKPWTENPFSPNWQEPLLAFRRMYPAMPVHVIPCVAVRQEEQYQVGLQAITNLFGNAAAVLIVDTDEIWPADSLDKVKEAATHPTAAGKNQPITAQIKTYLRSPLYEVWPMEVGRPVVALPKASPQRIRGRFSGLRGVPAVGAYFWHYPYVRADANEIAVKFHATASQEHTPSDCEWLTQVWPLLPRGRHLHMSTGHESTWREVKILPASSLPPGVGQLPFGQTIIQEEERRWHYLMETSLPNETLIPLPTATDWQKYAPELQAMGRHEDFFRRRLRMTCLEACVLTDWAKAIPVGGTALEVGSGLGGSLACLAVNPDIALTAIDPYVPYDELTHAGVASGHQEGDEAVFWETANHYNYQSRTRLLKLPSHEAAGCLPGQLDLVLIDGNHTEAVVEEDLRLYWPMVRDGGLLVGHDYTTRFPGVVATANRFGIDGVACGTSLFYKRKT